MVCTQLGVRRLNTRSTESHASRISCERCYISGATRPKSVTPCSRALAYCRRCSSRKSSSRPLAHFLWEGKFASIGLATTCDLRSLISTRTREQQYFVTDRPVCQGVTSIIPRGRTCVPPRPFCIGRGVFKQLTRARGGNFYARRNRLGGHFGGYLNPNANFFTNYSVI